MQASQSQFIPGRAERGVTLTELLVVLVIISILSTIAVPVYVNHAQRARVAAAEQEVKEIANAEDACGALHGFYVPIQVLNDIPGKASNSLASNANAIGDETVNALDFSVSVWRLASDGVIALNTTTDPRVEKMVEEWQGPFLNPQRVYNPNSSSSTQNLIDLPLDPWGNPYRLYSPAGATCSVNISSTYSSSDFNGTIRTSSNHKFDRWAVVSFGPDGEEDSASLTTGQDDIIYTFGITRDTNYRMYP